MVRPRPLGTAEPADFFGGRGQKICLATGAGQASLKDPIMTNTLYDALPDALKSIRTRPLFTMRLEVKGPVVVGPTPGASRRVGLVTGGVFEGERLSGQVLDGGADWQAVRSDGATSLDVRLLLRTRDDAMIAMTYRGLRYGAPEVVARMEKGEIVPPEALYFRIAPLFETAAPQYDWLNRVLAVGAGHRFPDGPVYSIFDVL